MSNSDLYRILIPSEYPALRDAVPKSKHRILIDIMLNTGMRYEELRGFAEHLSWFDAQNRCITIPKEFLKAYQGFVSKMAVYEKKLERLDEADTAEIIKTRKAINKYKNIIKSMTGRTVHLTPAFSKALSQYLREFKTIDLPKRAVMNENLRRWWIDSQLPSWSLVQPSDEEVCWYPTTKTFRKTWESYLLASGYDYMAICCSQGHSPQISYSYYANLDARLKSCMDEVKKLTEGWMT